MIKKCIRFITSLKFAIVLFLVIATYSIIGTVLPQGLPQEYYLQHYNTFGNLIVLLQFNNVYNSLIFRIILFVFIVNLVGCTLNILPAQLKRMKDTYFPNTSPNNANIFEEGLDLNDFKEALKKKKFKITEKEDGYIASKHRIGNLGSSITHLGIVIIILGAFIGNLFSDEGFFNILPGESKTFENYGFTLALDDFYLGFREDGSTEQYYSEFSIYEQGNKVKEEKIWVNKPLAHNKLEFFQSSFGWASKLHIKDKDGTILYEGLIRDDQHYFYQPEHLTVYLYGFYPDFNINQMGQPISMTQQMKSPHYAVVLYHFNEYIDSYITEPGQPIIYGDVEIEFVEPTLYTGITYRRDFGYFYVLIGCAFLMLGLLFSFYFYPKYVFVSQDSIIPVTRQNSWGYEIQIKNIIKTLKNNSEGVL